MTAFAAFFRGMADHIFKRLGQDETVLWSSSGIQSDSDSDKEEQRMLQLDGSTGEVDSSRRGRGGGKRRGRLKKLSGFVHNIHKKTFSEGAEVRGVGVKRKRGRPRKIQENPRILDKEEGKTQVKDQCFKIHKKNIKKQ